jgi:hypothetical protein
LTVQATWKDWDKERPEIGDYFFILGITPYSRNETILESLATYPKMLIMTADPVIGEKNGKYEMIGIGDPYPMVCDGCFPLSGNSELEIKYWILVEDLHPNFIKK